MYTNRPVTQRDSVHRCCQGQAVHQLAKKHCHGLQHFLSLPALCLLENAIFTKSGDSRAKPVPAVSELVLS